MKLEDLVQNQNETIDLLYNEYDSIMEDIKSSGLDNEKINKLHDAGLKLFNFMDGCYAALDAAEESLTNEKTTQLADLAGLFCDALEETIPNHYSIMCAYYGDNYKPSKHAFAGLQQLIVQVKNKKEIKELKEKCIDNGLPVKGFDKKRRFRMTKTHERIYSAILGILSIAVMVTLLFFLEIDDSSKSKYIILSVVVSLLGGIGARLLSGALNFKIKDTTATAGYAAFVIIFLILQGVRVF
ncbi:hypothetical protein SB6411_02146 [Klebsiella spallanzanii]|uniref:Uncharacterized protein n=1 Tax=Klebsiella spallanzanii TaxID=2587528 RepID=A0ABY6VFH1_9ENTR|nr:hypothetical protein [Klebsiella spallanzanii]VUS66186.1 hypothetical protein SB6411_02146 [Klebsiella spallanzanii]